MGYRGRGGYLPILVRKKRGDFRGDFFDDMDVGGLLGMEDFSDVTSGTSTVGSDVFSTMDAGSALSFPSLDFGSILKGVSSGIGALGPLIGSGVSSGVKAVLGGGSDAAAGRASSGAGRALQRALRGGSGRRMNPGNFRALRRSMRRLQAFERAARKVIRFTHPRPTARVKFKFPRRRKR